MEYDGSDPAPFYQTPPAEPDPELYKGLDSVSFAGASTFTQSAAISFSSFYSKDKLEIARTLRQRFEKLVPNIAVVVEADENCEVRLSKVDKVDAEAFRRTCVDVFKTKKVVEDEKHVIIPWEKLEDAHVRIFGEIFNRRKAQALTKANTALSSKVESILEEREQLFERVHSEQDPLVTKLLEERLGAITSALQKLSGSQTYSVSLLEEMEEQITDGLNQTAPKGDEKAYKLLEQKYEDISARYKEKEADLKFVQKQLKQVEKEKKELEGKYFQGERSISILRKENAFLKGELETVRKEKAILKDEVKKDNVDFDRRDVHSEREFEGPFTIYKRSSYLQLKDNILENTHWQSGYKTALLSPLIGEGKAHFGFRCIQFTEGLLIGVVNAAQDFDEIEEEDFREYEACGFNGYQCGIVSQGRRLMYGEHGFGESDTASVIVDMDSKAVQFLVNGVLVGEVSSSPVLEGGVYFAVSMYYVGCRIEIL